MNEIERYTVSIHYLTCIFNADFTGIDDSEELAKIEDFIDGVGTRTISVKNDEVYFGRCDICGLMSDVVDIEVITFEKEV